MNMQDYKHAADRVRIAEHCKEEVLSMTSQTEKRTGKPILHRVTGIAAAAACVGLVGTLGYSFLTMNQKTPTIPAASVSDAGAEISEIEPEIEPATEELEFDENEFPLFRRMNEEQCVKTFEWGTVRLESVEIKNENQRLGVVYRIHLNDDTEYTAQDGIEFSPDVYMYDKQKLHRIWGSKLRETITPEAAVETNRDFVCRADYALPGGGDVICETLGEDGEYHLIYTDFLEKEPMPEYLLYEIQINRVSVVTQDSLNSNADEQEGKRVLLDAENTPLFKFRLEDDPEEAVTEAFEKALKDMEEYPAIKEAGNETAVYYKGFGSVQAYGAGKTEDGSPYLELYITPDEEVREIIEQGAETYVRYAAIGHLGDDYFFTMDQGMKFAQVVPIEELGEAYKAKVIFEPVSYEYYHVLNENGEYESRTGDPDDLVSWDVMCVEFHFNALYVRSTPFEGENMQGITMPDALLYKFENTSSQPLVKFSFPSDAIDEDGMEVQPDAPAYPLLSELTAEQRTKSYDFGTLTLDDVEIEGNRGKLEITLRTPELSVWDNYYIDMTVKTADPNNGHHTSEESIIKGEILDNDTVSFITGFNPVGNDIEVETDHISVTLTDENGIETTAGSYKIEEKDFLRFHFD